MKSETSSSVVQWVQDLVLSLQWLSLKLWQGFDPWPWNFMCLDAAKEKKKKTEAKNPKEIREVGAHGRAFGIFSKSNRKPWERGERCSHVI